MRIVLVKHNMNGPMERLVSKTMAIQLFGRVAAQKKIRASMETRGQPIPCREVDRKFDFI